MANRLYGYRWSIAGRVNDSAVEFGFEDNRDTASDLDFNDIIFQASLSLYGVPQEKPKLVPSVATPPGRAFVSSLSVLLSHPVPEARIHYTLDGTPPDSASPLYQGALELRASATLRAIAYKDGWERSDAISEIYPKTPNPSRLEILDADGNPLPGRLSGGEAAYRLRLSTTQAGLAGVTAEAVSHAAGDRETPSLAGPTQAGDWLVHESTIPFRISAASATGISEASPWDTLVATCRNPLDPSDVDVARMPVRPAPRQAVAWFSSRADGTDTVGAYLGTETAVHVALMDGILPAGTRVLALIVTRPVVAGAAPDTETVVLRSLGGGRLAATAAVDQEKLSVARDGRLQAARGIPSSSNTAIRWTPRRQPGPWPSMAAPRWQGPSSASSTPRAGP